MNSKIRKSAPLCLLISLNRLLTGKLRFSKEYLNNSVKMEGGKLFVIFRHITSYPLIPSDKGCVFIVSFKFAHLSYFENKIASIIPMLLIAGFPGFAAKIYAVDPTDGYWQGMYQWKSVEHLSEYKKSFVFRMMNRRAKQDSITSIEIDHQNLTDLIESNRVNNSFDIS